MKSLNISVSSCNYCFTRGFQEITEILRHFTKALKMFKTFVMMLLMMLRNASVSMWNIQILARTLSLLQCEANNTAQKHLLSTSTAPPSTNPVPGSVPPT